MGNINRSVDPDPGWDGRLVIGIPLFVALGLVATWFLWGTGFCFKELRYLSPKELCRLTEEHIPKSWPRTGKERCEIEKRSVDIIISRHFDSPEWPKDEIRESRQKVFYFDGCGRLFKRRF